MQTLNSSHFRMALRSGAIAGFITLSLAMVGMVQLFGERYLVAGLVTMGEVLIFSSTVVFSYQLATKYADQPRATLLAQGAILGVVSALPLILLIWAAEFFDVRAFFLNVSPTLLELLTFGQGAAMGSLFLLLAMVVLSLLAVGVELLPKRYSRPLLTALLMTLAIGLFSEILAERIRSFFGQGVSQLIFRSRALAVLPAAVLFLAITVGSTMRQRRATTDAARPKLTGRALMINRALTAGFLLILPLLLGTYLSEVANNIGIYVLMGLGLNIVVGFAGLLDLGYVAFFAIGAYVMAILTSTGNLGVAEMPFWLALPISVAAASLAGLILGMPVLRMRGDYLAIVTLGFGEIIRILALSDLLKPAIGGAQGVLNIPKPSIGGFSMFQPEYIYYVILAGVLLALFVSTRLRDSRLGRQWMAMREDEDVAESMGINLVKTKLLAFSIGAAFSGLGGAIFAAKLTSIFPHSFGLLISINVLSLIIVGGMGSIPGVIAGAIVLVGLPELLREFQEFRLLMFGVLLIVMMLTRPEGFIPAEVFKRELHAGEEHEFTGSQAGS